MQGKIIKGIAGFYYVQTAEVGLYECKAKGIFRKNNEKPLVGDDVVIDILNEQEKKGNMVEILVRKSELIRPAVANVDQALIIFSIVKPSPNFNLLDRFLILMSMQNIPCIICFNKKDLSTEEEQQKLKEIYQNCAYKVLFVSAKDENGFDELQHVLKGKTTTVAGPSGVGKSSIINKLQTSIYMEIGAISEKIERGKHTTRHSELIAIGANTFIMDTPGFSSLHVEHLEKEELQSYYSEFEAYEINCKFQGCVHIHEPKCGVKTALKLGQINAIRYENYRQLYDEIKDKKKY